MKKCDDNKVQQDEIDFLYLGDVWHALLGDAQEKVHPNIIYDGIAKGVPFYATKEYSFFKHRPKSSLISCITVLKHEDNRNLFYSEFAFLKGAKNNLLFLEARGRKISDVAEGYILLQKGCAQAMWAFNPLYAQQKAKLLEHSPSSFMSEFCVAGLGWNIQKRSDTLIKIDKGPTYEMALQEFLKSHPDKTKEDFPSVEFDTSHLCYLGAKKYPDAYEFASDISAVSEFRFYGMKIYCLEIEVLKETDDSDIGMKVNLYVNQNDLNGYIPQVGDNISGLMQLSAYLHSETDVDDMEDMPKTLFQKLKSFFK